MNRTDLIKILKLAVVLSSAAIGICLISVSFYAYVLLPHNLTHEDMEMLAKGLWETPLFYFWTVYVMFAVRRRLWVNGNRLPRCVEIILALLLSATLISAAAVYVFGDEIQARLKSVSRLVPWMVCSVHFVPLFFAWVLFPTSLQLKEEITNNGRTRCPTAPRTEDMRRRGVTPPYPVPETLPENKEVAHD